MTVLDWLGINIAILIVSVFFLGWTHWVDSQYEDNDDDE